MTKGEIRSASCFPRPNWIERTFIKSDEAEDALCRDRPALYCAKTFWILSPHHEDPNLARLRELIEAYFNDWPPLRAHLRRPVVQPTWDLDEGPSFAPGSGLALTSTHSSPAEGVNRSRSSKLTGETPARLD